MRVSEVANRYASAIYDLAAESNQQEKVFAELRTVSEVILSNPEIKEFFASNLVPAEKKKQAIKKSFEDQKASDELINLLLVLAEKSRLSLFDQILYAYEQKSDQAHGVTRGVVRSATILSPEERKKIEDKVCEVTNKKVILTYKEDPEIIGGLVAEVEGFRFDDTLQNHLRRLKEEIKRRTH